MPWPQGKRTWLYLSWLSRDLFFLKGKVPGWPYGRLVRMTVRFRARVASLPRWLTPKITISYPLRRKASPLDPSLALLLYPLEGSPNPPTQGSDFDPVFLAFSCQNSPHLPPASPTTRQLQKYFTKSLHCK